VPGVTSLVSDVYHLLPVCRVHLEFRIIIYLQICNYVPGDCTEQIIKRLDTCVRAMFWNRI